MLFERRGSLLHQIKKWRELQAIYMPGVLDAGASNTESPRTEKAESTRLWLPSQLKDPRERMTVCFPGVITAEKELRFGQLQDSLDDLRKARRVRRGLILFHKVHVTGEGQKTQTKARAAIQALQDRIGKSIHRYRVARNALLQLDPGGEWEDLYLPLTDGDNRGPGKEQEEVHTSDGQYTQSWIWRSNTTAVSQDEVNDDMRVEWAQCMARAVRWEEEVTLLQEEMRRVVQFLVWRSRNWFSKVNARVGTVTPAVRAGISAYANKQGSIFRNLATRFSQRWYLTLLSLSLPHTWATVLLNEFGVPLTNSTVRRQNHGAQNPHVPAVCFHAGPSSSTITAQVPPSPSIIKATGDGLDTVSELEDSSESEFGSDSSSSVEE